MKIKKKIIAIDGPVASGKTTIGKLLSKKISYQFLDSGLLFRHFAKFYLEFNKKIVNCFPNIKQEQQNNFLTMNEETLNELLYRWQGELIKKGEEAISQLEQEREKITSHEISCLTSQLSTIPSLRKVILDFQRKLTQKKGWVVVGRDITSQVLPHAEIKIFLTASLEARIRRRYQEQEKRISLTTTKKELLVRDERDKNRLISPLTKTKDSWEVNTTYLSVTESVEKIYDIFISLCQNEHQKFT